MYGFDSAPKHDTTIESSFVEILRLTEEMHNLAAMSVSASPVRQLGNSEIRVGQLAHTDYREAKVDLRQIRMCGLRNIRGGKEMAAHGSKSEIMPQKPLNSLIF